MIAYEWVAETLDGEDIVDVTHRDTYAGILADAAALRAEGKTVDVGLVRDQGDEVDGLQDRQWAYLDDDGKLPQKFDGGAKVPERFHKEIGDSPRGN